MSITKFSHLNNTELLRLFADKRVSSPIIEELCDRLEALLPLEACPVCEADLVSIQTKE